MHQGGISIFQTWDKRQNNEVHNKQGFKNEVHIFLKINLENNGDKNNSQSKIEGFIWREKIQEIW